MAKRRMAKIKRTGKQRCRRPIKPVKSWSRRPKKAIRRWKERVADPSQWTLNEPCPVRASEPMHIVQKDQQRRQLAEQLAELRVGLSELRVELSDQANRMDSLERKLRIRERLATRCNSDSPNTWSLCTIM